jgi:hypothetical protein
MATMDVIKLINQPIRELGLSEEFSERSGKMGYQNIQAIIDARPEDLFNKDDFSYTWLGELSKFLIKHQILHLLQPAGGRKYV